MSVHGEWKNSKLAATVVHVYLSVASVCQWYDVVTMKSVMCNFALTGNIEAETISNRIFGCRASYE